MFISEYYKYILHLKYYIINLQMNFEFIDENFAQGKEGKISAVSLNGYICIMKQFKKQKSVARLHKEAEFQKSAAALGVAPPVLYVDNLEKRIFMEGLPHLFLDIAKTRRPPVMLPSEVARIEFILNTLDDNDIFHNDGNCRNLMMDANGVIFLIDYGMAKKPTNKKIKRPNMYYGWEAMKRSLRQNGVTVPT